MGKIVGLLFPIAAEQPKKAAGKQSSTPVNVLDNELAAPYKRMKTAELVALIEERGIEVPEGVTNNPQRVALLVQADAAAKAAETEDED